ncbi:uncharacterized protein [Argopecten irradians]|uniref:uncharacterized protein n=1 Tax=Argopecten irradians TaxID=31199 RepID=UPI00372140C5
MAESGQEKKDKNDVTSLPAGHLLDCPICLTEMRSPKSLPCLHSFCEECLGTYIVTDLSGEMAAMTSFPCPVCKKITSPVNSSDGKQTWARQFPTNSLIQGIQNAKVMSNDKLDCTICCKSKEIQTPAKYLCKPNGILLCDACKNNVHDLLHSSCNIVVIDDMAWKEPVTKTCSTHKDEMDFYCEEHKFIGCNKCIIADHRACHTVMTIKEFCDKQRKTEFLYCMDKSLEKALNRMELVSQACDDQEKSIHHNQDVGLKSITDLRQCFNAYFDKTQEEVTQELISKHKAEKDKVDLGRQKCRRLTVAIQNTREASRTAAQLDDHIEMIQLFHRGQAEIRACNDLIDEISLSKAIDIKHDIEPSLTTIDETSPLSLGRILVEEQPYSTPDWVEYIQNHGVLSESRVRKLGTIKVDTSSYRYGCNHQGVLVMADGKVVLSDYENKRLRLYSCDGGCLNEITLSNDPRDLCLVDDNTVAVSTASSDEGIRIVKVKDGTLTPSTAIKTPSASYGITFREGKFLVTTPRNIYEIPMEGELKQIQSLPYDCYCLASDENEVFATLSTSEAEKVVVTKLTSDVQTCVARVGVVKSGRGIDVDREGNLYVCGYESNNVVQMSRYGTQIRELLMAKDGIDKPMAISVHGNKFVVTNVSSQDKNNVHVYQLY